MDPAAGPPQRQLETVRREKRKGEALLLGSRSPRDPFVAAVSQPSIRVPAMTSHTDRRLAAALQAAEARAQEPAANADSKEFLLEASTPSRTSLINGSFGVCSATSQLG